MRFDEDDMTIIAYDGDDDDHGRQIYEILMNQGWK